MGRRVEREKGKERERERQRKRRRPRDLEASGKSPPTASQPSIEAALANT